MKGGNENIYVPRTRCRLRALPFYSVVNFVGEILENT